MKISLPGKIIIGILTAWVVLTPLLFFGLWFFFIFAIAASSGPTSQNPNVVPLFISPILFLVICTSFLHIGLQAFYIVHIVLNKTGSEVIRAVLGVGMIFLAFLAMPVYYFIYVLPANPPAWALTRNSPQAETI